MNICKSVLSSARRQHAAQDELDQLRQHHAVERLGGLGWEMHGELKPTNNKQTLQRKEGQL